MRSGSLILLSSRIPSLDFEAEVAPSICDQEMVAEDGVYSEYVGSGKYTGTHAGRMTGGRCAIELIGV